MPRMPKMPKNRYRRGNFAYRGKPENPARYLKEQEQSCIDSRENTGNFSGIGYAFLNKALCVLTPQTLAEKPTDILEEQSMVPRTTHSRLRQFIYLALMLNFVLAGNRKNVLEPDAVEKTSSDTDLIPIGTTSGNFITTADNTLPFFDARTSIKGPIHSLTFPIVIGAAMAGQNDVCHVNGHRQGGPDYSKPLVAITACDLNFPDYCVPTEAEIEACLNYKCGDEGYPCGHILGDHFGAADRSMNIYAVGGENIRVTRWGRPVSSFIQGDLLTVWSPFYDSGSEIQAKLSFNPFCKPKKGPEIARIGFYACDWNDKNCSPATFFEMEYRRMINLPCSFYAVGGGIVGVLSVGSCCFMCFCLIGAKVADKKHTEKAIAQYHPCSLGP